MKRLFKSALKCAMFATVMFSLNSCKKSDTSTTTSPYADLTGIITESQINVLKSQGLPIYSGTTPPSISGIYVANPFTLLSPYGPSDTWKPGETIADYKYQFYNQSGTKIYVNYKNEMSTDVGSGVGAILHGENNNFSLFYKFTGTAQGVPYTMAGVISGTYTSTGIKDFKIGFILTNKTGDQDNTILEPVNTGRVWYDGNNLASISSAYKMAHQALINQAEGMLSNKK